MSESDEPKRPVGRPRKDIDAEGVRKLAAIGCTQEEIGNYFGCSGSTVSRNFAREFSLGCAESITSLRRMQWKSAKAGSVPMQIHLGKSKLGQYDQPPKDDSDRADKTRRFLDDSGETQPGQEAGG